MAAKIGYKMFRIGINKKNENEGCLTPRLVWTNIKELLYLEKILKSPLPPDDLTTRYFYQYAP